MENIEVGLREKESYSEGSDELKNVKEKIRVIKVQGETQEIAGFWRKWLQIGYYELGEFHITFMCKLKDVQYIKSTRSKK